MDAVAWDEINSTFIALTTERDIKTCVDAEWPVARWNIELAIYEKYVRGGWQEVDGVEFTE